MFSAVPEMVEELSAGSGDGSRVGGSSGVEDEVVSGTGGPRTCAVHRQRRVASGGAIRIEGDHRIHGPIQRDRSRRRSRTRERGRRHDRREVLTGVDVDVCQRRVQTSTGAAKCHATDAASRQGRSRQAGDGAAEPCIFSVVEIGDDGRADAGHRHAGGERRIAKLRVDRSVVQRAVADGGPRSHQIVTGIERVGQAQGVAPGQSAEDSARVYRRGAVSS